MPELTPDKLFLEGIKERIEDMVDDDIYFTYGQLVARGELAFDRRCVDDAARLVRVLAGHKVSRKITLDW